MEWISYLLIGLDMSKWLIIVLSYTITENKLFSRLLGYIKGSKLYLYGQSSQNFLKCGGKLFILTSQISEILIKDINVLFWMIAHFPLFVPIVLTQKESKQHLFTITLNLEWNLYHKVDFFVTQKWWFLVIFWHISTNNS